MKPPSSLLSWADIICCDGAKLRDSSCTYEGFGVLVDAVRPVARAVVEKNFAAFGEKQQADEGVGAEDRWEELERQIEAPPF